MTAVTYTAKRSIASDHIAGASYGLDFNAGQLDRGTTTRRRRATSLSGASETLIYRQDVVWTVTTTRLSESAIVYMREFLDSVAAGEVFTFDPYGSTSAPDAPVTAVLESDGYKEARHATTRTYRVTFKVRII